MKKLTKLILFLFICQSFLVAENLYEDYTKAEQFYSDKEIDKGIDTISRVLKIYPDYSQAKILYFKLLTEKKDFEKREILFADILKKENDNTKYSLYNYIETANDIVSAEKIYFSIENKTKLNDKYIELLFKNKKYKSIASLEIPESKVYLEKIEKNKKNADESYYKAISSLKNNNVDLAISSIRNAINIFPENQVYYIKLGEIYADNKNFFLAELNFKEALKYSDDKKIYEKLFLLYLETKNYDSLYRVSKHISDIPYVKEHMKKITEELAKKVKITVLKREGNLVYIERDVFKDSKIGDSYTISKEKSIIENVNTGEYFGFIPEIYGKIRLFNFSDKVSIFVILEEYKNIIEQDSFYLF